MLLQEKEQHEKIVDKVLNRQISIEEMAAGIAHEIRNPLTAVKGFLDLLKKEFPHNYVNIANSELDRAIAILQNFLQVSKPDMDQEPSIELSLCVELEKILGLFQDRLYHIKVEKRFKNKSEKILGKRSQLKKTFFNLIKNAIEAISEQGVITIEHYREGDQLIVKLSDTGVGISKDKLELLGTPFFSTKDEGTGLGMAQVYSTINNHNASINVESEPNIGTTFTISFPVNKKQFGGSNLDYQYNEGLSFLSFQKQNQEEFLIILNSKTKELFQELKSKSLIEEDYELNTAKKIMGFLEEENQHEIILLAKDRGRNWAKLNYDLTIKLEWFREFRSLYMDLLYYYYDKQENVELKSFYQTTQEANNLLDLFQEHFILSFYDYRNNLMKSQREIIDSLSVPVIPLYKSMAILPIVGMVDTFRAKQIQERVLKQIPDLKIKRLIIDLSGVAYLDTAVVGHLFKIIDGVRLLGSKTVVTGIRPEVANTVIEMGIEITQHVEIKGTLEQAIEEFVL